MTAALGALVATVMLLGAPPGAAAQPAAAPGGQPAAAATEAAAATIKGTVTWRQAFPISPDAVLTVRLAEAARGETPGAVLAEQRLGKLGAPPIGFELSYDPARIDPNARYEVTARLEARGGVRFASRSAYPVALSGAAPAPVAVLLEPVL